MTIKRIKPFIPKTEYEKVYNALFIMSNLSYYISCWCGIPSYKLGKIFSIQKRCLRVLFGKEVSYDRPGFYFTCARIRTYNKHIEHKSYCLEHTKPLFNEHKYLTLKIFIFTTCSWRFLIFSNIAFHVLLSIYLVYVQEIKNYCL